MEHVYWINRTYIQNKNVSTAGRRVRPKTVRFDGWEEVGIRRYWSYVPPTGRVWHKAFLRWIRSQGRSPDTPGGLKNASGYVGIPLKGRQAINLAHPRNVRVWGVGFQRLGDAAQGTPQPTATGTRTQPCTDQCVSQSSTFQRVVHTAGRKSVFVVRLTNRMSVAQGVFRWVRTQGRNPDTPGAPQNTSGSVGIPLKKDPSGDKPSPSKEG